MSKKISKNNTKFLISVLSLVEHGLNQRQIARYLSISPQRLNYFFRKKLLKENFVEKIGYSAYRLTDKGRLFLMENMQYQKPNMGVVENVLSQSDEPRIEVWNYGYRFLTSKFFDPDILNLKKVPLKNNGHYYHGFLEISGEKYYLRYKPAKNELEIRVPIKMAKTVDEAQAKAMTSLNKAIEEISKKTKLFPIGPTTPDIIVRTEEAKEVAEKIIKNHGRVKTEIFDTDLSKARKLGSKFPDLEFKKFEHAKNFVENLAIESKADYIINVMYEFAKQFELHFSVLKEMKTTMQQISLIMNEIKETLKELKE